MTTPTPPTGAPDETTAVRRARSAEDAMSALRDVAARELAATPADAYAVLDHLSMVIGHTITIAEKLTEQLRTWTELCHDVPTAGPTAQRLERTRAAVGLGIVADTCRLFHRFEDALIALDRRRYRTDRGMPLHLPGDGREGGDRHDD